MFKHVNFKWGLAAAVAIIAALILATVASAGPAATVTFAASHDGASAGWSAGKGSPINLVLGSSSGSFAEVRLHQVHASAISDITEPSFTTSLYNAGSPRFYITLSNGDSLWGYPPQSGVATSNMAWAINNGNTYMSWTQVQAAEAGATVSDAYVIADADQTPGTTDVITGLTFGGTTFN